MISNSDVILGNTYTVNAVDNSIASDTNMALFLLDDCEDAFNNSITVINQDIVGLL